jgi:hypothetical protein
MLDLCHHAPGRVSALGLTEVTTQAEGLGLILAILVILVGFKAIGGYSWTLRHF